MEKPLALKLAPKSLKDVIGQEHLIGKDKIISNMVKNKKIFSMILYGEPGARWPSVLQRRYPHGSRAQQDAQGLHRPLPCDARLLHALCSRLGQPRHAH